MTRPYFLTIQKKFLFAFLVVGLVPAVVGVILGVWGAQRSFAVATAAGLEPRALEIADTMGLAMEDRFERFGDLAQYFQDDLAGLAAYPDVAAAVDFILYVPPAEESRARIINPDSAPYAAALLDRHESFIQQFSPEALPPEGNLDEIHLKPDDPAPSPVPASGPPDPPDERFLVFAYPTGEGGVLLLFAPAADTLLAAVSPALPENTRLRLYHQQTGAVYPPMLESMPLEALRRHFQNPSLPPPGWFNARQWGDGRLHWQLIAHSGIPRLARLKPDAPAASSPWVVVLLHDMESFLAPLSRLLWTLVLIALAWVLILAGLSVFLARRVVGPVKTLRFQAEAMAAGDLDVRADVRTRDEIQDLADSFNTMADRLRQSYKELEKAAEELEAKVEERTGELARANTQLIQAEKFSATGRLAANLAHEINNPLGIIKNYLRILTVNLQKSSGGRRRTDPNLDHLVVIDEEINRIARIVRQLLDLHRPADQNPRPTNVPTMLQEIVSLVRNDFEKKSIEIACDIEPDLPDLVVAPDLVRQIYLNLIRNAEDAMESGGTLTIRARRASLARNGTPAAALAVTIEDTGVGIPPDLMNQIFDPFFTTKSAEKGTGLGLYVSYGIVKRYHGELQMDSQPGRGTRVTVILPVDPPAEAEQFVFLRWPGADSQSRRGPEPSAAAPPAADGIPPSPPANEDQSPNEEPRSDSPSPTDPSPASS